MSHNDFRTSSPRRPDRAALAVAAGLAALAGVILWDVSRLSAIVSYSPVGPATIPYAIGFALLGLSVWTVIAAFRGDFPEREPQEARPVLWIVGGLAAQMLLLNTAGFSIATGVLFAATAYAFGRRQLWISLPVGILLCLGVWYVFARQLQLSLPAGPLENLLF
ncbi:tripartite tricarboxylate transporter TctB family protein [Rhizobiaceae bacterium BDR2-2]|uniref:Tripartite tricarboxylate transporter TctB family protein n=1 Tax=Ectorhizobium quercum TaxID=2965071 RepID=A0AAE3MZF8_9HYPH|nr:tripartite tricarboxylate transporter TctB family protein [Ectorhizobium quercum]MCX8996525.1 tripartite tricarboxylate transporter TctB family protein [Ectorhizobium quercum]